MPKKRKSSSVASDQSKNADDHDDDDANDNDDVATLWEKLQAKQRQTMQQLEEETEQLQQEKDTMLNSMMTGKTTGETQANDILTINAGGKIITALRSTLTIPTDSMWSYMFSGRWEDSLTRDSEGRIFLDYDEELIAIIVNYCREKKIEDPAKPVKSPPYVSPQKQDSFQRLLEYFGLVDFFNPPHPPADNIKRFEFRTDKETKFYEWKHLIKKLKQMQWTFITGPKGSLQSNCYVLPGKKAPFKGGEYGTDFFNDEDEVIDYCVKQNYYNQWMKWIE